MMTKHAIRKALFGALIGATLLPLSACVSLGGAEPPASLLDLTPTQSVSAGEQSTANAQRVLIVREPQVPAKINLVRVPVQVSDTEIAYLQDAIWVEKPARLFRRLMSETIRAKTGRFVIDSDDTVAADGAGLRGTLREFGFDARNNSVIVRFDAVRTGQDGGVQTRRFEATESGVAADVESVGPALNRAANRVASDVADWLEG